MRRLTAAELDEYDHIAREHLERVRIVGTPVLPPQAFGMTLGHTILLREGAHDEPQLIAHELVHVAQWAELGVVGFLRRYLSAYFRNLARLRRHHAAYLAIPLEEEAREQAMAWRERHPPV